MRITRRSFTFEQKIKVLYDYVVKKHQGFQVIRDHDLGYYTQIYRWKKIAFDALGETYKDYSFEDKIAIVYERVINGLSEKEVSEKLGIDIESTKSYLFINKLKLLLTGNRRPVYDSLSQEELSEERNYLEGNMRLIQSEIANIYLFKENTKNEFINLYSQIKALKEEIGTQQKSIFEIKTLLNNLLQFKNS